MRRSPIQLAAVLFVSGVVLVGCGGDDERSTTKVTATDRVDACLSNYADATRDACEQWEEDGQLADDGTHEGHESM